MFIVAAIGAIPLAALRIRLRQAPSNPGPLAGGAAAVAHPLVAPMVDLIAFAIHLAKTPQTAAPRRIATGPIDRYKLRLCFAGSRKDGRRGGGSCRRS